MLATIKSAVRSHAAQYNKASMLLHPLGEGVQNISEGLRLRQQSPVFSFSCCSAPSLVEGSTGGADGEEFQISKGFFLFPSLFYPTGSGQMQTQHTGVCVHVCSVCLLSQSKQNLNSATHCPVCVWYMCVYLCVRYLRYMCVFISRSPVESPMSCSHHHLIPPVGLTPQQCVCLNMCACV